MLRLSLGRLTLIAIGGVGLVSTLVAPQQYDYVDQRPNATYADVKDVETLKDALADRFLAKPLATWVNSKLVETGLMEPVIGALAHGGYYYYTDFFGPAPITSYRGLYTEQSERTIRANGRSVTLFARDLNRCGVEFAQIVHPSTPAVTGLYEERGIYRDSDVSAYIAAADEDVRPRIIDLTGYMREQAREHDEPIYYLYGTHPNRLGADLAALEISRRLVALGVLSAPLEPGRFSAAHETDRVFDVPPYLGNVVDDDLYAMLWGSADRPQERYPPTPDGLLDGVSIVWANDRFTTFNENALSPLTAVVLGDSYNTYLAPYFARMFRKTVIIREQEFNANWALQQEPDIVIFNRNARGLHFELLYSPGPEECPARAAE